MNSCPERFDPVLDEVQAVFGQVGFGMVLDSQDGQGPMSHSHDFSAFGFQNRFQTIRQISQLERMVAGHLKACGKTLGEKVGLGLMNRMDFSVDRHDVFDQFGAEKFPDRLMAEADTKNGNLIDIFFQNGHQIA